MKLSIIALLVIFFTFVVPLNSAYAQAPSVGMINDTSNLRGGPGTEYPIVGHLDPGASVQITGCNSDCTWYQLDTGNWIAAFLVEASSSQIDTTATTPIATEPAATAVTSTESDGFTIEELAYIDFGVTVGDAYEVAFQQLFDQFTLASETPTSIMDDDWIVKTATAIAMVQVIDEKILSTSAPTRFAQVHQELVSAAGYFDQAMNLIIDGIGNLDASKLADAQTQLLNGTAALDRAVALIPGTAAATVGETAIANSSCPQANTVANLRSGPSTAYDIAGSAQPGVCLVVSGRNVAGDWYQLDNGYWISASLVDGVDSLVPVISGELAVSVPAIATDEPPLDVATIILPTALPEPQTAA